MALLYHLPPQALLTVAVQAALTLRHFHIFDMTEAEVLERQGDREIFV